MAHPDLTVTNFMEIFHFFKGFKFVSDGGWVNTSTGRTMIASQMVPAQSPTVANGVGMEMMQEKVHSAETVLCIACTVKPVLSDHSKRRPKFGFQNQLLLNAGQKYCGMLQESILQYFRPLLSYHLPLRPLFYLFLSGRLRQVLL